MKAFFDRLRARRTVLKRTRKRPDLPEAALYIEWIGGENKRRLMAPDGTEHVFADKLVESYYKIAGKADGTKLIEAHWSEEVAKAQEPARKADD